MKKAKRKASELTSEIIKNTDKVYFLAITIGLKPGERARQWKDARGRLMKVERLERK